MNELILFVKEHGEILIIAGFLFGIGFIALLADIIKSILKRNI